MANTSTNQGKGFENVKNIKINVLDVAKELQRKAEAIQKKAGALSATIKLRDAEFAVKQEVVSEEVAPQPAAT